MHGVTLGETVAGLWPSLSFLYTAEATNEVVERNMAQCCRVAQHVVILDVGQYESALVILGQEPGFWQQREHCVQSCCLVSDIQGLCLINGPFLSEVTRQQLAIEWSVQLACV